jgi:hypothetical protein
MFSVVGILLVTDGSHHKTAIDAAIDNIIVLTSRTSMMLYCPVPSDTDVIKNAVMPITGYFHIPHKTQTGRTSNKW